MLETLAHRLRRLRLAREVLFIAGAYMAYELVRSMAAGRAVEALQNADLIVRAEQALGIFAELNLQVALLSYSGLVDLLSLWYFWGHFPLLIAVAIWTFYRHNDDYRWARNAVLLAGGIALIAYATFPVAPPRLVPAAGFVDTLRGVFALQYDDSSLVNQYAAVPSMHQGFALIVGATLFRIWGGRRGAMALVFLSAVMLISIVATGNHWFLDAVLGVATAIAAMVLATQIERRGLRLPRPHLRRIAAGLTRPSART